jgi:Rod binding domain-containing protein
METVGVELLKPVPAVAGGGRSKAELADIAQQFEATYLSSMLAAMMKDVRPAAPFNGGAGEEAFGSFLTDAMARQLARAGGVGLADGLSRELLKLQGLEA